MENKENTRATVYEKCRVIGILVILYALFVLTLTVMTVHRIYPDGKTDNPVFLRLLARISINTIVADDQWQRAYPFEESGADRWKRRVLQAERSVENYCTTSFPQIVRVHRVASWIKERAYCFTMESSGEGYRKDTREKVTAAAENVVAFRNRLAGEGCPFLYVETPGEQMTAYQGQLQEGSEISPEWSVEANLCFMELLETNGVNTLRMPDIQKDTTRYDLSGHWFPDDALLCAQTIIETLNGAYGLQIDPSSLDTGRMKDVLAEAPDLQAVLNETYVTGYKMQIPAAPGSYRMIHAEEDVWEGAFSEVFLRESDSWVSGDAAYQEMLKMTNGVKYDIYNNDADAENKSILVLGDSFSWSVNMYLATGVRKVTFIYNPSFNGSLLNYVQKEKPDIVLMIYNDDSLCRNAIQELYDLR